MEFNIVNDTTETAYFQLGIGTFVATYQGNTIVQNPGSTPPAGTVDVVAIAPLGTQTVDIMDAFNAKLLLSMGQALVSDAPSPSNSGLADYNTLWDKVELFLTTDVTATSVIDLRSTDFYGFDPQVQTFASPTVTVAAQTLGWTQPTPQMLGTLAALTNGNTNAVMVGSNGIPEIVGGQTLDVLRVIAPSTEGAGCAPLVVAGDPLVKAREMLLAQAQRATQQVTTLATNRRRARSAA